MPDFTMCSNGEQKNCPQFRNCFRFLAEPNPHYQSYADFIDICNEEDDYHFFVKVLLTDKTRSEEKILENKAENND